MKKHFPLTAGLCLLLTGILLPGLGTATAQDQSTGVQPPPKVLDIGVEFPKLGLDSDAHENAESEYVRAFSDAKSSEHYLAMEAISGTPRVVFFNGYDSFAAAQANHEAMVKNDSLMAALKKATTDDEKLLQSRYSSVFVYDEDLSLRAPVKISDMRFFEITIFDIRPGHRHDWSELVKIYQQAWSKAPDAHWATFEEQYGPHGDRYIVISPLKSLTEVDQELMDDKKMAANLSADDKKKMADLSASTIESEQSNLFAISPKMSYVPDSWKEASPDFWGKK
jgi:hypothetical protein